MNGSPALHNQVAPWRIYTFGAVIVLIFLVYVARLFSLQVIQYPEWMAKAEDNRQDEINVQTLRGIIYDRNGVILARNVASYNVVITPANLPDDPGEVQEIFRQLSELLGQPVNQGQVDDATPYVECKSKHGIAQIAEWALSYAPFKPVKIQCNVSSTIARLIQEKASGWPGVSVEVLPVRDYPTGVVTANIIGYLGPIPPATEQKFRDLNFVPNRDKVGYAGVEYYFQSGARDAEGNILPGHVGLGGHNGLRTVEMDVAGRVLRDIEAPVPAQAGDNLYLTIDYRLQQAAYSILVDEITAWNRVVLENKKMTSGVVIAMNPKTGEILAMISYPGYENNRLAREIPGDYYEQLSIDSTTPLLNHAVGDELNVGSVFKLVTATGALNEGVVTPQSIVQTPGFIQLTEKYYANDPGKAKDFVDWIYKNGAHPEGFGSLDIFHCLAYSSNVCFYKLGGGYQEEIPEGLGICRLGAYARALGYGDYPQVQLPDIADGLIPDPTWKRINQGQSWSTGDTYLASVGQGFIIGTPIQVLVSAATIANNGKLMEPTILREITDSEGKVILPFTPHMRWDLTVDPIIEVYDLTSRRGCETTGEKKTIEPWVFQDVRQGMRLAAAEGTLSTRQGIGSAAAHFDTMTIAVAGKTGTAEYCDKYARDKALCEPGNWPTHAWTVAFAPYDDPEIAVVAFVYNGGEGASTAGPIVRRTLEAYFELKAVDAELGAP